MILTAAYLHDIGIKESERKHQSAIAWYQAEERSPAAKEMLTRLGAREELSGRNLAKRDNRRLFDKEAIMKVKRKIIKTDEELCDGCGQCVPSCAEGAIQIVDGKAKLVEDKYCDGLGACLGECPNGALTIVEQEAEEFDEEAVEEYLSSKAQDESHEEATMACGCPSTQIQSFVQPGPCQEANELTRVGTVSALSHWPVQIRLVPPTAPFLKGADLLVAADCTPVAYPNFHQDFLKGKVVMVGCPKFDDIQDYIQRFADIFHTADITGITVVVMEVPCCQGLPIIIEKGMEKAGKKIPLEKVVISSRGDVLDTEKLAA